MEQLEDRLAARTSRCIKDCLKAHRILYVPEYIGDVIIHKAGLNLLILVHICVVNILLSVNIVLKIF